MSGAQRPLVIAHRGGAKEAPENTLLAFRGAVDLGVDGIECDVHATKDGQIIVHHDRDLAVGAGGRRIPIAELSASEVSAVDLGWTHGPRFVGEAPPLLSTLLDLMPPRVRMMIELKDGSSNGALAAGVVSVLRHRTDRERCFLGSFSAPLLSTVAKLDPGLALQGILDDPQRIPEFDRLALKAWALDRRLATPELVARLSAKDRCVWSWTVKERGHIAPILAYGITGLITDIPTITRSAVSA